MAKNPTRTPANAAKTSPADQVYGAARVFLTEASTLANAARNYQPRPDAPDAWKKLGMTYAMAFVAWCDLTRLLTPAIRAEAQRGYQPGTPAIRLGKFNASPTVIAVIAGDFGAYLRNALFAGRPHPLETATGEYAKGMTPGNAWMLVADEWETQTPTAAMFSLSLLRCDSIDFAEARAMLDRESQRVLDAENKPDAEPAPERLSHFTTSTDPKVTTCEAWKSLMQFRHELLTNTRQDNGVRGWWSGWVGTMQGWLSGGDWGGGYYAPTHRVTTPDCAVCLVDVKAHLGGTLTPDALDVGDDDRTVLFPAGATYLDTGTMIDWAKPFPPIADRGPLVEWVESWIDRIAYTEATGHFPWEPVPDDARTVSLPPDVLALLQRAAAAANPTVAASTPNAEPATAANRAKPTQAEKQQVWLARAMLTVRDHPDWSDASIARAVGVSPSTLSRSEQYKQAAKVVRQPRIGAAEGKSSADAIDNSFNPNRKPSRQWETEEDNDSRIDREIEEEKLQRKQQRNASRNDRR